MRAPWLIATLILLVSGCDDGTSETGDTGGIDTDTGIEAIDLDGDGYASEADGGTDCDDDNAAVHPGADELCNEQDDDCDGDVDEAAVDGELWFADTDGDGFGDADVSVSSCSAIAGYVTDDRDCDDTSGDVHPGAGACGFPPTTRPSRRPSTPRRTATSCASRRGPTRRTSTSRPWR